MTLGEIESLIVWAVVLLATIGTGYRQSRLLDPARLAAVQGKRLLQLRLGGETGQPSATMRVVALCLVVASAVVFFSSTPRAGIFLALGLVSAAAAAWAGRISRRVLVELGERGRVLIDPDVQSEAPRRVATARALAVCFTMFVIPWQTPGADDTFWIVVRGCFAALGVPFAIAAIVYALRFQSAREYAIRMGHVAPDPPLDSAR